jgi:hypothetical protein
MGDKIIFTGDPFKYSCGRKFLLGNFQVILRKQPKSDHLIFVLLSAEKLERCRGGLLQQRHAPAHN